MEVRTACSIIGWHESEEGWNTLLMHKINSDLSGKDELEVFVDRLSLLVHRE